jgi:biotin carboxyl carrier protein
MKQYKFKINGTEYAVDILEVEGDTAKVTVNGAKYRVEVEGMTTRPSGGKTPKVVKTNVISAPETPAVERKPVPVAVGGGIHTIKTPLPGVVISLDVKVGEMVKVGQRLFVLEAMKMENNIDSDREGIVREIKVDKGDSVLEGDIILTIG